VLSRGSGVDVYTGGGLEEALAGVEVVIDTLNTPSLRRSVAEDFFVTTARRLRRAATRQGVEHLVALSILGLDRVDGYPYYDAKLAEERELGAGPVPVTLVRSAQFFEFPAMLVRRTRFGRVAVVPHLRSQPVAARTVGAHLAALAASRPGGMLELAGPETVDIADLAQRLVAARGERLQVFAVSLPGRAARDMRGDALLAGPGTTIDGPAFEEWLASADARAVPLQRAPVSGDRREQGAAPSPRAAGTE
jgi:uncharacterized protein YbjT (DUF2867 family)